MRILTQWRKKEFIAKVSGRVADNMFNACQFAADKARSRAPQGESGRLIRGVDIDVEITARDQVITGRVGVRKSVYYAYFVEMGTRYMAAKPFLRPAVFENADEIVRRIQGG